MSIVSRVGLVGCGTISETYLRARYPEFAYVACADLDESRAARTAELHGLRPATVPELLASDDVDIVCNLTVPAAHLEISRRAIEHDKHVYVEKPLALDLAGASALLDLADAGGRLVGCAPDTFLGAGLQTCRRLVDEGAIGTPVAAMAHMVNHGHEHWHPDPAFYYERGGGPLLDMGPYYLTALVALLGPITRASASSRGAGRDRVVAAGPRAGEVLRVEVPTHVAGVLDFAGGAVASLVMSFDVYASDVPKLEIHGSDGSLALPDPNTFGGPVRLFRAGASEWEDVPIDRFALHQRGVGLADLAGATRGEGANRASGRLALHVLDAMLALGRAATSGTPVELGTSVARPREMVERAGPATGP